MEDRTDLIITSTQAWVDEFIIGENICPFAKHIPTEKLQLKVDSSNQLSTMLEFIAIEMLHLQQNLNIETSLVIYPNGDPDFLNFLDTFYACDQILEDLQLRSVFQLVCFHPKFCFDNAPEEDAANYTNRSPYPMIHILRESSVSKAVEGHPDVDSIPERNMEHLRKQAVSHWGKRLYNK